MFAAFAVLSVASFSAWQAARGLIASNGPAVVADRSAEAVVESAVPAVLQSSAAESVSSGSPSLNALTPSDSLADVVANAANGAVIELAEGIYRLADTIRISGKSLTLKGAAGTSRERVIIDGDGTRTHRRCFYINNTEPDPVRFEGLTVSNGCECGEEGLENFRGGGIWAKGPFAISNCVITCCVASNGTVQTATMGGGGLYVSQAAGVKTEIAETAFLNDQVVYWPPSAPATGTQAWAYGGGAYLESAVCGDMRITGCEFRGCLARSNWSRQISQFVRGNPGGAAAYLSRAEMSGCKVRDNSYDSGDCVGALALNSSVVSNCLISGNRGYYGGGICVVGGTAAARSVIADCTISRNEASRGGGLMVGGAHFSADIQNCLIEENGGIGAGIQLSGSNSRITGCMVRNNVAGPKADGGGLRLYALDTKATLVTNNVVSGCVFFGNKSGGSGAGIAVTDYGISNVVADCMLLGNEYTGGNGIGIAYVVSGNNCKGNVLRNCLLKGNTQLAGGTIPLICFRCNTPYATLKTFSAKIESCTIAGNSLAGASCVVADTAGKMPNGYDAIAFRNNLIAGNASSNKDYRSIQAALLCPDNMYEANLTEDANWNEYTVAVNYAGDPLFRDADGGDYRLKSRSPAKNRGIVDKAWMTCASQDLGDGTYALVTRADDENVPEHGIRLAFNGRGGRVQGLTVDIGCFESINPGFMLIVK